MLQKFTGTVNYEEEIDKGAMYHQCRYIMNVTIKKWGNSLALRLPKALASEVHITEGAEVDLIRTDEGLLLKPKSQRRYRLSELVRGITSRNVHLETDWGTPVGREIHK